MRQMRSQTPKRDLANAAGRSNLLRVRELTPGLRAGHTFNLSAREVKAA
jgi:hypothetical protein